MESIQVLVSDGAKDMKVRSSVSWKWGEGANGVTPWKVISRCVKLIAVAMALSRAQRYLLLGGPGAHRLRQPPAAH